MKKIIACIDDNMLSKAVCDYAIYMAKSLNIELVFIHVIEIPQMGEDFYGLAVGSIVFGERDILMGQYADLDPKDIQENIEKAKILLKNYVDIAKKQGVNASYIVRDGDFIDIMSEYKDEARLFIIGIKDEHNDEENIGFNPTMLIKELKTPVLLVNKEFSPINSVLIAFDETPAAFKTLEFIKNTPLLHNKVQRYIINVNSNKEQSEQILNDAQKILGHKDTKYISIIGEDVAEEIIKYRRANNLDLIATGAFSKSFFAKLFHGSVSQNIMQNALVPILVLA